jgi:hypothetical protein
MVEPHCFVVSNLHGETGIFGFLGFLVVGFQVSTHNSTSGKIIAAPNGSKRGYTNY